MTTGRRRWLPIVAGVVVLLVVVAAGVGTVSVLWLKEQVHVESGTSAAEAAAAFDAATRRFPDPRPLLTIGDDRRPQYAFEPGTRRNPGTVSALGILAWDERQRALATVTLPLWLLRLKSGPIAFGEYVSGLDDRGVRLQAEDLERYGPGVVVDLQTPDGRRVLLTAQ